MAKITLAMWSTHGPILNTTPDEWLLRVPFDKKIRHWFKGRQYSYEELLELRGDENLAAAISLDERTRRHARCQAGIEALADLWEQHKPDVAIIMGNDQRELIAESMQPMFALYHGDTFWQKPLDHAREAKLSPGIKETEWAYRPDEDVTWPGLPGLASHMFGCAQREGFDLAAIREWPDTHPEHWHIGTPHAFAWIIRRIMRDRPVPILPVFTNTFHAPNQPTATRCFEFGEFVRRAVETWGDDKTVAVFGSGGMSHFVINEELDQRVLDAIQARDRETLVAVSQDELMQGTSELRNWISTAGIAFGTDLSGDVIDYVPCYRTEAGTGTAQGFVCWT